MKLLLISISLILFLVPGLFRMADYEARENDSRLYTRFVGQLEARPISQIIALEWRNYSPYQDPNSPYVRDHLVGQFVPSVILSKLGWDSAFVHYVVNQLYRLLIPILLYLVALKYVDRTKAFWIMLSGHLNIMALNYGLRANQEQALLFGFALSLYGFSHFDLKRGRLAFYFGGTFAFLVKGLVGLIHYPFWILWVLIFSSSKKRDISILASLGLLLILSAGLYEYWFQNITGVSFWKGYFEIQVFGRKGPASTPFSSIAYYTSRTFSYSLPWILGIYFLIKNETTKLEGKYISLCALLSVGLVVILGSFSRHASRYIFPVYYLVSGLGALGYSNLSKLKEASSRFDHIRAHFVLYWSIFLIQYVTFLYKGKTYIN